MTTRLCLSENTVTVLSDDSTVVVERPIRRAEGTGVADLSAALEGIRGGRLAVALMPPAVDARIVHGGSFDRAPKQVGTSLRSVDETIAAVGTSGRTAPTYVATCSATFLKAVLDAAEASDCRIVSITSADHAWSAAACTVTGADDAVVAVELREAGEIRLIAAADGVPVVWRRLPLQVDGQSLAQALDSVVDHLAPGTVGVPLVALGDDGFRTRLDAATRGSSRADSFHGERTAELNHDPAAVAATFAGTGPRFVPEGIVRRARARTRRRGLIGAAVAVVALASAGLLDVLDLRSELDEVRSARRAIAASVEEAMDARDAVVESAATLSTLERLRATTPRWTAMLAMMAEALPRTAHVRALRTVGDSVYVELEGRDVAAAVDGLREIPWWRGLRTTSAVETEVEEAGVVTERVTVAAVVGWEALNESAGQTP